MSLVLIVIGAILVAVGVLFAVSNKATDKAGGSGLRSISVEGPAWLVLIVIGLLSVGWGVMRWEDRTSPAKPEEPSPTPPTVTLPEDFDVFEDGFTFGDNAFLDELWLDCEFGIFEACEDLYFESEVGSEYEWFGALGMELLGG